MGAGGNAGCIERIAGLELLRGRRMACILLRAVWDCADGSWLRRELITKALARYFGAARQLDGWLR